MGRLVAAALFLGIMLAFSVPAETEAAQKPLFLKSVVYTGSEWSVNFWSTEMEQLDEDMAHIASDGFNSIILMVPWCEFQPDLKPAAYNLYAFDRLDEVMDAAEAQGLWVQLRVSYTWDYTAYEDCRKRFHSLLSDPDTENAWISYMKLVYESAAEHENFYGGFIACEDFWNELENSVRTFSGPRNVEEAGLTGYQDYLREHYTLQEINSCYRSARSFDDYNMVYIPSEDSPALKLYYEFYDAFLNRLLKRGQEVFPGLSMEVRLDEDPVADETGEIAGIDHASTFSCGDAAYTCVQYRVLKGETSDTELTAAEALDTMADRLSWLKGKNSGKPVYIDRLVYLKDAENSSDEAELSESARSAYLSGLAPVLKKYTNGYGVGNYRNSVNNALYNSQFALEDIGWETSRVRFDERNGSMAARLEPLGRLSQKCGTRIEAKKERDNYVRFTADSDHVVTLTVALGTKRKNIRIDGQEDHILNFGQLDYDQIAFSADGDVYLDNVQVYNLVQDGQLYDRNGKELSCIAAVRGLNAALK